jgi:hypothetical protein
VTVSTGAWLTNGSNDMRGPADFLRMADKALCQAKGSGRDCVRVEDRTEFNSLTSPGDHNPVAPVNIKIHRM